MTDPYELDRTDPLSSDDFFPESPDTRDFITFWVVIEGLDYGDITVEQDSPEQVAWLDRTYAAALRRPEGEKVEIYALAHAGHDPRAVECECIQYLADHHPNFVWVGQGQDR